MEGMNNITKGSSIGAHGVVPDKFRAKLHLEAPTVEWRYGKPPTYESANHLFEEGRTKVWPKGSLEETVQNAVKSWQVEINNKTRLQDFNTINPQKFKFFVNGREGLTGEEVVRIGTFNALLKSALPEELHHFKAHEETFESAHNDFKTCFPRGFAWEVIEVYSPPPLITYKFRHWGYFEGPYKAHSPTTELVQLFGMGTLKVDSWMKVEEAHFYFDPAELFGSLLKGNKIAASFVSGCPFSDAQK
ncbi:pathogen-related protein-like [Cucurbita pepo subsp. pepo]|uniref:pathogen-related protein-like n=1 Tax=Cucurbita pepo subsp. pepo TaxID=3664 RepID=UPI000C9D75E7|nr:pathogen-related protein-like [Cucurbita pepo subsp. pepo]